MTSSRWSAALHPPTNMATLIAIITRAPTMIDRPAQKNISIFGYPLSTICSWASCSFWRTWWKTQIFRWNQNYFRSPKRWLRSVSKHRIFAIKFTSGYPYKNGDLLDENTPLAPPICESHLLVWTYLWYNLHVAGQNWRKSVHWAARPNWLADERAQSVYPYRLIQSAACCKHKLRSPTPYGQSIT